MTKNYEYTKRWNKNNPEKASALRKRHRKAHLESVVFCSNHFCKWSQEDVIKVLDYSLSARDLHVILKRTVRSIESMRQRLKNGLTPLAGISSELLK